MFTLNPLPLLVTLLLTSGSAAAWAEKADRTRAMTLPSMGEMDSVIDPLPRHSPSKTPSLTGRMPMSMRAAPAGWADRC